MPDYKLPSGFTPDESAAPEPSPVKFPAGFTPDSHAGSAGKQWGIHPWLPPMPDVGGIAKGIADFPQEAPRQAAAHKGETLAQRAHDPADLATAESLAVSAGPSHLKGPPSPVAAARPAAIEARKAGYVLPPTSISKNPGIVSEALAGWGGKIKTQQHASARNQEVTNDLAHKALGLPADVPLMPQIFNDVRQVAGAAYKAVANAVPEISVDPQFSAIRAGLGGANSQAAKLFPKITNNPGIKDLVDDLEAFEAGSVPTPAAVEIVKELRFNATENFKARGDPSKHALGIAQREAAEAIDDLMDRNISATGQPGLIDRYRQARKLIARSYDVEAATNPATGDVRAHRLAALAAKGKPLTDELHSIANAASAFPKSMQPPAGFGYEEPWSVLDVLGSTAAVASGHPEMLGVLLGRPLARAGVLSKPMQAVAAKTRGGQAPNPNAAIDKAMRAAAAGLRGDQQTAP